MDLVPHGFYFEYFQKRKLPERQESEESNEVPQNDPEPVPSEIQSDNKAKQLSDAETGESEDNSFVELLRPAAGWRQFPLSINFLPILDPEIVQTVERIAYSDFFVCHHQAVDLENERVRIRKQEIAKNGYGRRPTARPTDVAIRVNPARLSPSTCF